MKTSHRLENQKLYQKRFIWFSLIPIICLFLTFNIIPIFANVVISFLNYSPIGNSTFVGFANYLDIPNVDSIGKIVVNTFVYTITTSVVNIVISTLLAVCIYSISSKRTKDFFRVAYFLPAVLPIVAISYIWKVMFNGDTGLVNGVLKHFGITDPIYWLSEPISAMICVIMVTLFVDLGYNLVLVLSGLENIPKTYLEAAKIDGANSFTQFFKITLPLLSRTMIFVCIMTTISYFQVFTQIDVLTKGGPDFSTEILSYTIFRYAFRQQSYGIASAISVLLLIIILIVSAVQLAIGKTDWEY